MSRGVIVVQAHLTTCHKPDMEFVSFIHVRHSMDQALLTRQSMFDKPKPERSKQSVTIRAER